MATAKRATRQTTRQQAIQSLKARTLGTRLLCLDRSWRLERSLAVWCLLTFRARSEPARRRQAEPTDSQLLADAWHDVDSTEAMRQLRAVFEPSFPAARIIVTIQGLGLAYPDGTLHPEVEAWLAAVLAQVRAEHAVDKPGTQPPAGVGAGAGLALVKGREP